MSLASRIEHDGVRDEVAVGFLVGEGLIDAPRAAGPPRDLAGNVVEVEGPLLREPARRRFYATSSCGVCGKGALEEIAVISQPLPDGPVVDRALLAQLPQQLAQPGFERT